MGIDIFDYDFTKYQIDRLIRDQNNDFNYFDVFSKLHYRITLHGYIKQEYKEMEQKLTEEHKYRRDDNMDSRENYSFKYIWTSYYEFIGYLTLNNFIEKDNQSYFRINDIIIDPTFPKLPAKIQLVNDCFLPAYNENTQDWINSDKSDYLENIYNLSLVDESNDDWVLLNAYSTQKDDKVYHNKISIFVDALAYGSSNDLEYIVGDEYYLYQNDIYNIYAGELPWGINTNRAKDPYFLEEHKIIKLSEYYSFQSWNHSRTNLCQRFPYLSVGITVRFVPLISVYLCHPFRFK